MLSAFPLIVGPVLLIAAERHGAAFAAQAAAATLLGLVALAGFVVVYAWSAVRVGWAMSLLLAWAAAAALGLVAARCAPASRWPASARRLRSPWRAAGFRDRDVAVHGRRRRGT